MESGIDEQKLAIQSGYYPIFRYDSNKKEFHMDMKDPNFELLDKFINNETRFQALKIINEVHAKFLFDKLKTDAKERYEFYKSLENNQEN